MALPSAGMEISADMLNPVAWTFVTNDLLIPASIEIMPGMKTRLTRGIMLEIQIARSTGIEMSVTLEDIGRVASEGYAPHFVTELFVEGKHSREEVSSLAVYGHPDDGSFIYGFEECGSDKPAILRVPLVKVMRASANVPFISPKLYVATNVREKILDGGLVDNYGFLPVANFLMEWMDILKRNFDNIVIIMIRQEWKKEDKTEGVLSYPYVRGLFASQRSHQDVLKKMLEVMSNGKLCFFTFELPESRKKVSLSWHLTAMEKKFIYESLHDSTIKYDLERVASIILQNKFAGCEGRGSRSSAG